MYRAFLRGEGDFSPDAAADSITDLIYRGLANEGVNQANMLREPVRQIENGLARLKALAESFAPASSSDQAAPAVRRVRASRK